MPRDNSPADFVSLPIVSRLAGDKVYTRLKFINLLLVHRLTRQKADIEGGDEDAAQAPYAFWFTYGGC